MADITTPGFWEQLQRINENRASRWHPRGLDEWSRSDWANALQGEAWEWLEVIGLGCEIEQDELADQVIYALLIASSENDFELGRMLDRMPMIDGPRQLFEHVRDIAASYKQFSSAVKEHCRNRDGVAEEDLNEIQILIQITFSVRNIITEIRQFAAHQFPDDDFEFTIARRFNETSEKFGFPERIHYEG